MAEVIITTGLVNFLKWFLMFTGVYLGGGALIIQTENLLSGVLFKAIPFFTGMTAVLASLQLFGVL